jgi:hypothetical protein
MAQPARDTTDAERDMGSIGHNPVAPDDASLLTAGGARRTERIAGGTQGTRGVHLGDTSPSPRRPRASALQVTQEQHQGHVAMTQHGFLAPDPGRHHSRPSGSAGALGVAPGGALEDARVDASGILGRRGMPSGGLQVSGWTVCPPLQNQQTGTAATSHVPSASRDGDVEDPSANTVAAATLRPILRFSSLLSPLRRHPALRPVSDLFYSSTNGILR